MFNNTRKFKNTFAPASKYDSFLDIVSPGMGSVIEVSTFWKERLLQVYTFSKKGSVYLSNKDSANSIVVPTAYLIKNKIELFKITDKIVECYPVKSKFSYYSKEGEVPHSALLESSRLVQKMDRPSIFIQQGDLLCLDSDSSDFKITINYKKASSIALPGKVVSISLSELSVLLLSFVGLLFLFLYNKSIEVKYPEATLPDVNNVKVVFKKPILIKKIIRKETLLTNLPQKSRGQKKDSLKRKIVSKSVSSVKNKKLRRKRAVFIARKAKRNASLKGGRSGGRKKKKIDVNSVGLLGVFAKSGLQKKVTKNSTGAGGLYGLARSKKNGTGVSSGSSGTRFGSGLKGKKGGSVNSTVKVGGGIGSYGSSNGVVGGSLDLGSPSKVSVSYAGKVGDDLAGGGIDSAGIYRVIQAHKNVIRFCYQKEQDYYPSLSGLVRLYWRINDRGRVMNAKIKTLSSTSMRGVGNCIVKNLKSWKFPKAPKSSLQAVEFPFRFKKK